MDTRLTVLAVDDDLSALTLIGIMLERGGYNVLKAASAAGARDVLEKQTPDLILLDVTLPDKNGIDVCAWMRQRLDTENTPILILSGRSDNDTMNRCLEAGANDFLVKPLRYVDLLARLRSFLQPYQVKAVS